MAAEAAEDAGAPLRPPSPTSPPSPPSPLRRARVRAGWHGLAAGLAIAVVFSAWPSLDLRIARAFHLGGTDFVGDHVAWVRALYRAIPVVGWGYAAVAIATLALGRWRPGRVPFRWRRRAATLLLVSALGSLLFVNLGLKEHWGRARPREVVEVVGEEAGARRFSPALVPTDQCRHNCSFTSGHAASGFVVMSVGLLGAPATRRRWWRVGLVVGLLASLGRVMQGGHFASDTLFSGWAMWACGWLVREAWLWVRVGRRRRRSRPGPAPE